MEGKMKKAIILLAISMVFILSTTFAYAAPGVASAGGLGVNSYSSCSYGDRAGASYLDSLLGRMPATITRAYSYKNDNAYPSRMTGASKVDLFIYSGHGVVKGNYTTAHFRLSSASGSHPSHTTSVASNEASTNTVRFTHAYVSMYTCNWLNFDASSRESNFWKTFSTGCRIQCGFGSTMYLDSREGNMFGYRMVDYIETIKTAFFNSAKNYQPQNSGTVKVRVAAHNSCKDDTFYAGYSGSVTSFSSSTSGNYASYSISVS
jgi:hypothetical protein